MDIENANFITPRWWQGQIVETSYAWVDGDLYRRTFDSSDRSCVIERAIFKDFVDIDQIHLDVDDVVLESTVDDWEII